MHAHRDVEIVTWVRSGAITYEDDAGNRARRHGCRDGRTPRVKPAGLNTLSALKTCRQSPRSRSWYRPCSSPARSIVTACCPGRTPHRHD
ncbi:pirin family protein [Burkholderia sp. Bp9143]|uniref:pirin family protein n=1 Tax=Burkholderia sp. Bp9143 TaxID=2184574 RepID=UPI0039089DFD